MCANPIAACGSDCGASSANWLLKNTAGRPEERWISCLLMIWVSHCGRRMQANQRFTALCHFIAPQQSLSYRLSPDRLTADHKCSSCVTSRGTTTGANHCSTNHFRKAHRNCSQHQPVGSMPSGAYSRVRRCRFSLWCDLHTNPSQEKFHRA